MIDQKTGWRGQLATVALVAAATGLGILGHQHLAAPDLVMLYLLVIGVAAAVFGRGPSLVASALSVLSYDFFFVPPFYKLTVADERNLLTFAMMFAVGLVTSGLTLRIRREERQAHAREERTGALYSLSRDLGSALDENQAALVIARKAAELLGAGAEVLFPGDEGKLLTRARSGPPLDLTPADSSAAQLAFERGRIAGLGTELLGEARVTCVPLTSGVETLGVVAFVPRAGTTPLGGEQRDFLEAFARQAALACARARFADRARAAALRARTEELRSSLLSAVSHDLRTPLAAITGAGTTLRDESASMSAAQRAELLGTICEEAERLDRLVRNLLDMTRIESGAIQVKRDWVPLEEIVGSALARVDDLLAQRPVRTELPANLPLVSVDPVLLEQVFVNLLENAVKYTPAGSPLDIDARSEKGNVVIELGDRGPGLPAGSESRIFEKFFRGPQVGASGAGLGLAICRGVVEAHAGTLTAENRPGGGALFRINLPVVGEAPALPAGLETQTQPPSEGPIS